MPVTSDDRAKLSALDDSPAELACEYATISEIGHITMLNALIAAGVWRVSRGA